jgi:hypothetical protein
MNKDTSDKGYPAFALYYRSGDNGKWYEEEVFPDEWSARDCMVEHIRLHSDLDCVIVRLSVMSEYRGYNNPVDMEG